MVLALDSIAQHDKLTKKPCPVKQVIRSRVRRYFDCSILLILSIVSNWSLNGTKMQTLVLLLYPVESMALRFQ